MRTIDLRSDTVTRPNDTMRALDERVADLLGVEAAPWVPSGCMGNPIALMAHLRRGDAFLATDCAHVLGAELGAPAWLAGGMPVAPAHDGGPGRTAPATLTAAVGSDGPLLHAAYHPGVHREHPQRRQRHGHHARGARAAGRRGPCRWLRKMLGGGVRQGGVLAAAGLVALDRRDELKRDHETARILADGLRSMGWGRRRPGHEHGHGARE